MTRVNPLHREQVDPILQDAVRKQESQLGVVPESLLTMAHRPEIAAAWAALSASIMGTGTVSGELKQLISFASSATYGCRYCQAHTAHSARKLGVESAKLCAAFDYEASDLFTEAEQAALALAQAASMVPNQATDGHFRRLERWFSEEQIVEITAVIAQFGFLNRWNSTLATTLDEQSMAWAHKNLSDAGWEVGVHAP
jgi:uncharacterized peroxidase-related enzyme